MPARVRSVASELKRLQALRDQNTQMLTEAGARIREFIEMERSPDWRNFSDADRQRIREMRREWAAQHFEFVLQEREVDARIAATRQKNKIIHRNFIQRWLALARTKWRVARFKYNQRKEARHK